MFPKIIKTMEFNAAVTYPEIQQGVDAFKPSEKYNFMY